MTNYTIWDARYHVITADPHVNVTSYQLTQLKLYDFFVPILGTIVILLNLMVVISSGLILKKGQEPRASYLLLGNVAMCDMVMGLSLEFNEIFPLKYRNHELCAAEIGLVLASVLASVYSVGLIAIDRYLYILYGLHYGKWVQTSKVRFLIGATWILGLTIGFLPLMGWSGPTWNGQICSFILIAPKYYILLTNIFLSIPLIVVLVLYSIILYHSLKRIVRLQNYHSNSTNKERNLKNLGMFVGGSKSSKSVEELLEDFNKQSLFAKIFKKAPCGSVRLSSKWRAIKIVLFTTFGFLVTWGPSFSVSFYYVSTCEDNLPERCKSLSVLLASPLILLGFVNSLLNPIIYAWWHKGFHTFVTKNFSKLISRESANSILKNVRKQSALNVNVIKITTEKFRPIDPEMG